MVCSITNGIVLVVLNLRGILQIVKVKHRIILSSVVTFAPKLYRYSRYVSKCLNIYIYIYVCVFPNKTSIRVVQFGTGN